MSRGPFKDYTDKQIAAMSDDQRQQMIELWEKVRKEEMNRPYSKFLVAVEGARTRDGGIVECSLPLEGRIKLRMEDQLLSEALVGDTVRYPSGTRAKIISGSGVAAIFMGHPIAIVGSMLDNGDIIISTPQDVAEFRQYHHLPVIEGFLVPNWMPPYVATELPS